MCVFTWSSTNIKHGLPILRACLKLVATAVFSDVHTMDPIYRTWRDMVGRGERERSSSDI